MLDNPFEVGEQYRNRIGTYEVLAFEDDQMTILYENGRVQTVSVGLQARIWENIQIDESPTKKGSTSIDHDDGLDTWPIKALVQDILNTFPAPHPPDLIDQVFVAIENNHNLLGRYEQLVLHFSSQGKNGKLTVNSSIGWYTRDLTGMVTLSSGNSANSSLIQTYSTLGYEEHDRK
ncbi:MAG: hypothetical protein CL608_11170 [Anaerolineaceae bacterium]|nr:hypothetical protein [Anaerolineaceae bacterium]